MFSLDKRTRSAILALFDLHRLHKTCSVKVLTCRNVCRIQLGGTGQAHHTQISVGLSAGTFSWKQNETARADAGPGQKRSKDPKSTPLTPVSRASHPMGSTIILKALGKPAAASPLLSGAALPPEFAGYEDQSGSNSEIGESPGPLLPVFKPGRPWVVSS